MCIRDRSISLPKYLENEIYFSEISDGDLFKTRNHNQKAAEIFRSYGVNKSLREVWPVLKLKDTICLLYTSDAADE